MGKEQKILLTEVGYVSLTDGKYHYYLKDHQGNNRVVVDEDYLNKIGNVKSRLIEARKAYEEKLALAEITASSMAW